MLFKESTSNGWSHLESWHPETYEFLRNNNDMPSKKLAAEAIAHAKEQAQKIKRNQTIDHFVIVVSRSPVKSEKKCDYCYGWFDLALHSIQ